MTHRALELGYITDVTKELYYGSSDREYKKSIQRFHNHLVNKIMKHKEELMSSQQTDSRINDGFEHSRLTRQAKFPDELRESSFECGGVPILPGPKGNDGVRGPPGMPGGNGIPGRPGKYTSYLYLTQYNYGFSGINGAPGMAGDPGEPGMEGPSGSPGSKGYPGKRGIYGSTGKPGLPGQCSCFKVIM